MAGKYTHLFSQQAAAYAAFRPSYPRKLFQKLYAFAGFEGKPELAVDIATGSGQAAAELARTFKQVLAIDSNEEQLRGAAAAPNITYQEGLAEATGVPSASADLVTVAQALHWFDFSKFWPEAGRILKPGGTLAAWGYGLCRFQDNPAASQLLLNFAYAEDSLGPYWSQRRRLVDEEYASLMGYLSSMSAYATFRQRHPERPDPLVAFRQQLLAALPSRDEEQSLQIEWPIFMLMAKKR